MANTKTEIVKTETEGYVYADAGNYRVWYTKKDKSLRLKLYGVDNVYYVPKNSKMYEDLMSDFFGGVQE